MTPDELARHIPPEVIAAAREAFYNSTGPTIADDWRACCAAMLAAWPGAKTEALSNWVTDGPDLPYVEERPALILPLSQEPCT